MNELITINNGKAVVSSLEIAEHFEKRHCDVIDTIRNLTTQNSVVLGEMFFKSEYTNSQNKKQPMYYMNRDGFTLLCMGFTGSKAMEWKLKYIEAFNTMEKALTEKLAKPLSPAEMFLAQAQLNVEHERRLSALEENQRRLVEVCGIPSIGRDEWQIKMKERISDLCQQYDLEYKSTYDELYRELEDKTGCNVESRRRNLRKRLRKAGATCKERDNVSKLMVVSKDLALATAFEGIVQRFAARIVSENM